MVAFWEMEIEADTRIQKAIGWAAVKNDLKPLIGELLDFRFEMTPDDRRALAEYLNGELKNPPGRRPAHRRTIFDSTLTAAQIAANDVRQKMQERRDAGLPIKGWLEKLIEECAQDSKVNPDTVRNHLKRSQKPRANKKLRGVSSSQK